MLDVKLCMFCESINLKHSKFRRPIEWENQTFSFFFCKECRAFSLFPELTEAQLASLYSNDYSCLNSSLNVSYEDYLKNHGYQYSLAYLKQNLDSSSLICDFGCGFDKTISNLASTIGAKYFGVEYDNSVVSQLAKTNETNVYMNTSQLESSAERFDFFFIGDVLEHVSSPQKILKLASQRIKPDGKIIIQGPLENANTVLHNLVKLKSLLMNKRVVSQLPYHVSLASKTSINRLLQHNNLEVLFLKTYEVQWPVILSVDGSFTKLLQPLIIAKFLDLQINRFFPSTGNRFLAVAKLKNLHY